MALEILTQSTHCLTEGSPSFAELGVLYGEKGVAEAQVRLQLVLEFKSLKPKTVHLNDRRVPSPAVDELARKAGVSLGTLWRWYCLYRLALPHPRAMSMRRPRWALRLTPASRDTVRVKRYKKKFYRKGRGRKKKARK